MRMKNNPGKFDPDLTWNDAQLRLIVFCPNKNKNKKKKYKNKYMTSVPDL